LKYAGEEFIIAHLGVWFMRKALYGLMFMLLALVPNASASSIAQPTEFDVTYLYPLLLSLFIGALLWKFFVPRQLSALQVAFEIDDNLYEVHRLTRTTDDARDILQQGRVAFGVGLYMMGMLGVLLLISELLFQPEIYFEPNLWIHWIVCFDSNFDFTLGNNERSVGWKRRYENRSYNHWNRNPSNLDPWDTGGGNTDHSCVRNERK
jgi:hypothetical protein